MRKRFDKSPAIDAASNLRLVTMIEGHDGDYSARELEILEEGKKMLEVFEQQKSKELKMASPMTKAKMAYKPGEKHAFGWATTTVRASSQEVLAFVWDTEARCKARPDDLEKAVDERLNAHNMVMYVRERAKRAQKKSERASTSERAPASEHQRASTSERKGSCSIRLRSLTSHPQVQLEEDPERHRRP